MKLKIERDRLLKPLGHVSGVVEKRQTLPILGNVYIKQEQKTLTLIGTDLETEVLARVALLEKSYLGAGSSGRNTAILRANYRTPEGVPFYHASLKLYEGESATSGNF